MPRNVADQAGTVSYRNACAIKASERDHECALEVETWPGDRKSLRGWQRSGGGFTRVITSDDPRKPRAVRLAVDVHETILRFPSAPVYGLQRHEGHHHPLPSQPFHTFRRLRSSHEADRRKVKRYILMHTGLNETYDMGLYYRLPHGSSKQSLRRCASFARSQVTSRGFRSRSTRSLRSTATCGTGRSCFASSCAS
jgi:hypothetical protein